MKKKRCSKPYYIVYKILLLIAVLFFTVFFTEKIVKAETHPSALTGTAFGVNNSCMWGIDSDNTLWIWPADGVEGTFPSAHRSLDWLWNSERKNISQ